MRRKSFLIGACALALLQWGCMDYKEFSEVAIDPFSPTYVVPVAADTAYVTDVSKLDSTDSHVRIDENGDVYMYYETRQVVPVVYKITPPQLPVADVTLKAGEENKVEELFHFGYNIAALQFKSGTMTVSCDDPSVTNIQIAGHNVPVGAPFKLDGLQLDFDKSQTNKGEYCLVVANDCKIKFSDPVIGKVGLAAKQDVGVIFSANHRLGHTKIDLFSSNFFADHDFNEATFSIKVEPKGTNLPNIPIRFSLLNVAAAWQRVNGEYDGTQIPEIMPDMYLKNTGTPGPDAVPFGITAVGGTGATHWSYYMPEAGNVAKEYKANKDNCNLVEVLSKGPNTVDFGYVECQYAAREEDYDKGPFFVDLSQKFDSVILTYDFSLPLRGRSIISLWVHDITLDKALPDPQTADEFNEVNKYLDLQDEDYVTLYLQFTNRIPLDVYASVEFRKLDQEGNTDLSVRDSMRLDFNGVRNMPEIAKKHFTNDDFQMFLAAESAPVDDQGVSTGESKNLVTCNIPYKKYKILQRNAEMIRISYFLRNEDGKPFKIKKPDYMYVRVGLKVKPTVSYNLKQK